MLKDDSMLDTVAKQYYYDKGYAEGYSAARVESEKQIAWWREIVEQIRDDNDELRTELNSMRMRGYY